MAGQCLAPSNARWSSRRRSGRSLLAMRLEELRMQASQETGRTSTAIHQCMFEAPHEKQTRVLTDIPGTLNEVQVWPEFNKSGWYIWVLFQRAAVIMTTGR